MENLDKSSTIFMKAIIVPKTLTSCISLDIYEDGLQVYDIAEIFWRGGV